MAVYREFFNGISKIQKQSRQIFPTACDFGAPCKKDDEIWTLAKQLAQWYGNPGTRSESRYETGSSVSIVIEGIDEWAVSDERKTIEEATEMFWLTFTTCKNGEFDGFVNICKV